MEDIKTYQKTAYLIGRIRKYLQADDTKSIFIDINKMDSQTAGDIENIIYSCLKSDKIDFKTTKSFYTYDHTVKIDEINKLDPEFSQRFRTRMIQYINQRMGQLGNYISHVIN